MNKEYIYKNGKCIIVDEEGNETEVNYTNNIEEILVLENQVEELERILKNIMIESKYNEGFLKDSKKKIITPVLWASIITVVMSAILLMCFGDLSVSNFCFHTSMFAHLFGNLKMGIFLSVVGGSFSMLTGALLSRFAYSDHKHAKNNAKAYKITIKKIEYKLDLLKSKIKELKNGFDKENQDVTIVKKVNDKEALENLRSYLQVCFDCGFNEDKFNKYYQSGTLFKKLGNHYTEDGLAIIEEYCKEQENQFIKKRIKK